MNIDVPVFIEERGGPEGTHPSFRVRPLFFPAPEQRAEKLSRALSRLATELSNLLRNLGDEPRHDDLARWAFAPALEHHTLELRLELESGSHPRRFFLAGYRLDDRQIWFLPSLPNAPFEVFPGQDLATRATAALTRLFRDLARHGHADPDEHLLHGKGRITLLPVPFEPGTRAAGRKPSLRALLFGSEEKMSGERELRRVGRSLNLQFPDELQRAVGLDRECDELARLLTEKDRRPILVVGPRKVGKTTLIHELAWRIVARKRERYANSREIWLVSPMRLISGMSTLGEWESRVTAILEDAGRRDRVLYFDDLPGLFAAGVSSASDLNVAQVLKTALQRRQVRILAEITPESLRALRERDRTFADLFHVVPLTEPPEPVTLRVLVDVARRLEDELACRFDTEVLPTVYELQRRHGSDAAFPGKAAGFLQRLASRARGSLVTRERVLEEFSSATGIGRFLLDDAISLDRTSITDALHQGIVGQDDAVAAFADAVVVLKARLNDPRRPLGTFLLLGPTGVGKTQAAKTLAHVLFGDERRLLRFDMNEFVDGAAAARLVGTPDDPEGLLTGAVRRQPFSVLLLDEFEKAAPEVSDLLLAVLDEGRLTDALGRVADFTQSVVLLTSNLGAAEARARLGFRPGEAEDDGLVYRRAAERFFRPEFFNRIDRVLPFRPLSRAELEGIAQRQIGRVLSREGLRRRETLLHVAGSATDRLVALGHHPQLGARALKRVIEREVAQPIAADLAQRTTPGSLLAVLSASADAFTLDLRPLTPETPSVPWPAHAATLESETRRALLAPLLDAIEDHLDALLERIESEAPRGPVPLDNIPRQHARYFACRDRIDRIRSLVDTIEDRLSATRSTPKLGNRPTAKPVKVVGRTDHASRSRLARQRAAVSLQADLADLDAARTSDTRTHEISLTRLLRELALLDTIASGNPDPTTLQLQARQFGSLYSGWSRHVLHLHADALLAAEAVSWSPQRRRRRDDDKPRAEILRGLGIERILTPGQRLVTVRQGDGSLALVELDVSLAPAGSPPDDSPTQTPTPSADHGPRGPVIEEWSAGRHPQSPGELARVTDCRTGLSWDCIAVPAFHLALLDGFLTLPPAVAASLEHAAHRAQARPA